MQWSNKALELLEKIPDEVRPMARQMMELYAREKGIEKITDDLMNEIRNSFESQYGEQKKCPFDSSDA